MMSYLRYLRMSGNCISKNVCTALIPGLDEKAAFLLLLLLLFASSAFGIVFDAEFNFDEADADRGGQAQDQKEEQKYRNLGLHFALERPQKIFLSKNANSMSSVDGLTY